MTDWRTLENCDQHELLTQIDPDWRDHWPDSMEGVQRGLEHYNPTPDEIRAAMTGVLYAQR